MDIKSVEQAVAKIQSALFRNSNSISVGMFRSHFRGSGLQFKEHQIYYHGDDVRFMDWKLMAKTNKPYIKTFEEERNVEIVILIDCSLSMFLGYEDVTKIRMAIELSCLIYLLSRQTGDKVHTILVTDKIINFPPLSGPAGIALLISKLQEIGILLSNGSVNREYRPAFNISHDKRYAQILRHIVSKKEVVIFSDFINFLDSKHLKSLKSRRNIHCFKLQSPIDSGNNASLKKNYSIWGLNSSHEQQSEIMLMQTKNPKNAKTDEDEVEKIMGGKLKKINCQDRYLEKFIREMV